MEAADQLRAEFKAAMKRSTYQRQADVARALGVSQTFLSDVLAKRRKAGAELLRKAAQIFQVGDTKGRRWQRLGAIEDGWEI